MRTRKIRWAGEVVFRTEKEGENTKMGHACQERSKERKKHRMGQPERHKRLRRGMSKKRRGKAKLADLGTVGKLD